MNYQLLHRRWLDCMLGLKSCYIVWSSIQSSYCRRSACLDLYQILEVISIDSWIKSSGVRGVVFPIGFDAEGCVELILNPVADQESPLSSQCQWGRYWLNTKYKPRLTRQTNTLVSVRALILILRATNGNCEAIPERMRRTPPEQCRKSKLGDSWSIVIYQTNTSSIMTQAQYFAR